MPDIRSMRTAGGEIRQVLFLCTGNYYRSRFAEILFTALCEQHGLRWCAESRGLAIELGVNNVGPISDAVAHRLRVLGIPTDGYLRMPLQVCAEDFERADLIIAVKEAEHRPLLLERHPEWQERVEYWNIHDLDFAPPEEALQEIEENVRALAVRLATTGPRAESQQ